MVQVNELHELIGAFKLMGVIDASAMYSFFERRVQQLQKRCQLGFDYRKIEDPLQMCVEELASGEAFMQTRQVLLDVTAMPYVPMLFATKNQPKEVSTLIARVLFSISHVL